MDSLPLRTLALSETLAQSPKAKSSHQPPEQVTASDSSSERIAEENHEEEPLISKPEHQQTNQVAENSSSNAGTAEEEHKAHESTPKKSVGKKILKVLRSKPFIIGAGVVAGAAGAVALAPVAVGALGFSAAGIQAGSVAASMMSALGGGATASGSVVAVMQSVGATGTVLGSMAATGTAGAAGAACGAVATGVGSVIADRVATNSEDQAPNPEDGGSENEGNASISDNTSGPTVVINTTCRICGTAISKTVPAPTENTSSDTDAAVPLPPTCDSCGPFFNQVVSLFLPDDVNAEDVDPFLYQGHGDSSTVIDVLDNCHGHSDAIPSTSESGGINGILLK